MIVLDGGGELRSATAAEGPLAAVIQPWDVLLSPPPGAGVRVRVTSVTRLGGRVRVDAGPLVAEVVDDRFMIGDELVAGAHPQHVLPVPL